MRLAHAIADTLITPLNDSFVDFDVLGTVDPASFGVTGTSHYAQLVEARAPSASSRTSPSTGSCCATGCRRSALAQQAFVGDALAELSRKLNFRFVDGLAERTIFREFYPRGLTAVDDLDELTLGTRPTMSHATARLEVENLLAAIGLSGAAANSGLLDQNRDAA